MVLPMSLFKVDLMVFLNSLLLTKFNLELLLLLNNNTLLTHLLIISNLPKVIKFPSLNSLFSLDLLVCLKKLEDTLEALLICLRKKNSCVSKNSCWFLVFCLCFSVLPSSNNVEVVKVLFVLLL